MDIWNSIPPPPARSSAAGVTWRRPDSCNRPGAQGRRSDATVPPASKPGGVALEISTEPRGRALVRLCQGLTGSRCLELAESEPEALEMIGPLHELLEALVAAGLAPRADRGIPG